MSPFGLIDTYRVYTQGCAGFGRRKLALNSIPADDNIDWVAIQRKPRRYDEMSCLKIITDKEKIQENLTFASVSHRQMASVGVVLQL